MREFQMKKLIIGNTKEDFCIFKLQLSPEIIGQENGLVLSHILIDLA